VVKIGEQKIRTQIQKDEGYSDRLLSWLGGENASILAYRRPSTSQNRMPPLGGDKGPGGKEQIERKKDGDWKEPAFLSLCWYFHTYSVR